MKYTEFEKIIADGTGGFYNVCQNDKCVYVYYKDKEILSIRTDKMYSFHIFPQGFSAIVYSRFLWNNVIKLAETPLKDREEESKYNVIIGNNSTDTTDFPLIAWGKSAKGEYYVECCCQEELKEDDRTFTESEYQKLLEYIKTLPNSNKQLKIVEIGKTIAEV